nr:unnamed protein product [Callosobruchus chinensis]
MVTRKDIISREVTPRAILNLNILTKLQRICAYLPRLINNIVYYMQNQGNKLNRGPFSADKGKLDNESKVLSLNQYLDEFGLLGIGGRINH